jgi:hypothetical protein
VQAQGSLLALLFFDRYFSEMDDVLDFIRDFGMADYSIDGLHVLIGFIAYVTFWTASVRLISSMKHLNRTSIKRVVNFFFSFFIYGFFLLIMLHAFLNEDYFKLGIELFMLVLSKNLIGKMYDRYDRFVDNIAEKTT